MIVTSDELKQLSKDIREGRVATQLNCESVEELLEVFTPLKLMNHEQSIEMRNSLAEGGIIYEYYDNAIKQRISDRMPTFWFFHSLNAKEVKRMITLQKRFNLDEEE